MGDLQVGFEMAGYHVDSLAGRGGMGVVYRATDLALERPVALKLITADLAADEEFRARFKRESRIAASIRHPNVITVFRAGEEDGLLYIAMDYVEGTDLKEMIAEQGRLEPQAAARIVAQVASALDAAHAKALVHRDVKPANVLIAWEDAEWHAYLTDFGLSKGTASDSAMTKTGTFVGTLDYVAPEQVRGDRVDARTDVYALGCVLYHCLTGRLPYPKDSDVAKLYAHAHEALPSAREVVPGLPAECDDVIRRAMAKDPAERFQSAGDLGRAAVAAVTGRSFDLSERIVAIGDAAPVDPDRTAVRAAPAAAPTRISTGESTAGPRRPRRRRWLPAAAVAGIAAVAVGIAVALAGGGGDDRPAGLTKDQYQDQVLDAARPYQADVVRAGNRPAHVKAAEAAVQASTKLADLRKSLDRTIAAIDRIPPPADVKDLHGRVLQILRASRKDLAAAGAAAGFGNDADYRAALMRFKQDNNTLDRLAPAFRQRGYDRLGQAPG
jgi:hypothetical protein